jgi:catechol 2,3-dioxygenase-like lactoylglutathione lyase family enzyme
VDIGWLDICLRVSDVRTSRAFYESLGFRKVEGSDDEGWAVVVSGESRIGLYEAKHMGADAYSLNFRGGDVEGVAAHLEAAGHEPVSRNIPGDGSGSATFRDPDGHVLFFDRAPGETKKT